MYTLDALDFVPHRKHSCVHRTTETYSRDVRLWTVGCV